MKSLGLQLLLLIGLSTQLFAFNDLTQVEEGDSLFEAAQITRTQNPDSAISLLLQGYSTYIEAGDTSGAIRTLMLWAGISGHLGNYRESYEKLWKALILANEANLEDERAYVYIDLGRYYSFFKRKEEAFHYLGLSLDITKKQVAQGVHSQASLVKHYYSICATYRELNDPELAQKYLDSCFLFFDPGFEEIDLPKLKLEQAYLLKEEQKYLEALAMFQEIKPWFEEHRPANQVLLLTYTGDTHKALKNYRESESCYQAALAISERYNSHLDFTPLVHEKLADLYASTNEFSLAYQSLSKAKKLDVKIFDSRSENNRPLLEILDDFRKEQENREKLLREKRIAQLMHEDEVQFLQRTILIVSLILLVIIGFVYFSHVRSKHRHEKLEYERNKEIDQIKLRLFTNVSHEFKTPLTLILGPLQQLLSRRQLDASMKSSLQMMERNARQLKRLINEILEFRKIESAEVKLNASFGDILAFSKRLTHSFEVLAKDKNITLSFGTDEREARTWFDQDKLEKILNNLISNAIKYTPSGGAIRVTVKKVMDQLPTSLPDALAAGFVELVVEDTGPGIPPDQSKRVFDRFYQIDSKSYSAQLGSGIGLALTKELVSIHHGDISLQSEEGKGSRFIIRLPLGGNHLCLDQKNTGLLDIYSSPDSLLGSYPSYHLSQETSLDLNYPLTRPQILPVLLIVEDHPDMLAFVCKVFENEYRILQAKDGHTGLQIAQSEVPDLIISDVMMPVMDGITLCRRLKSNPVTDHIPVILLTARSSIEHRIEGLQFGADAYIPKPFHHQHLKVRAQKLLEQREALKEKYEEGNIKLDSQKLGISDVEKKFLQEVEGIIEQNLSNPDFTVTQLHRDLGFSRMQFYRKLKSTTGLSANEFIRAYKVKKAAVYLRESHLNITEILYEVGFTNRSYFSKCFKQMFGMSPREYINKHKAHHV